MFEGKRPEEYPRDYMPRYRARHVFCHKCNVTVTRDMEHCEDCQVCVEGIDHHCVFFSKCIARGNLYCFWGALAGVLVNFGMLGFSLIAFGDKNAM